MTLGQILGDLNSVADDLCVVARRPWSEAADAMLVRPDNSGRLPNHLKEAGYEYFLEVNIIRDEVLGEWNPLLNSAQRLALVLYYAEHDAWPEWFHEFCQTSGRSA
jgi:hypothetical protein